MKDQELPIHELEQFEKTLSKFQSELSPSVEFQQRMKKRLERHSILMQQGTNEMGEVHTIGFWSRFGTGAYTAVTAFAFVLFTGSLSTFAYTTDSVTNGNPLYPIKRGLETIENTFTGSAEAQAEFQLRMIARRLAESRFLTLRGVIDENTTQEVNAAVNEGIAAIQDLPENNSRDVLLERITTLLKEEEKKYYEIAGVEYRQETPSAQQDSTIEASSQAAPQETMQPDQEKNAAEKTERERKARERRAREMSTQQGIDDARPNAQAPLAPEPVAQSTPLVTTPSLRENITIPLNVETRVIEAIQQNSEHLKLMEIRLSQVRRTR